MSREVEIMADRAQALWAYAEGVFGTAHHPKFEQAFKQRAALYYGPHEVEAKARELLAIALRQHS